MTIASRFTVAVVAVTALGVLSGPSAWAQQRVVRAQTDAVQRAIAEALHQATGGLRHAAARSELQPSEPKAPLTEASEVPGDGVAAVLAKSSAERQ